MTQIALQKKILSRELCGFVYASSRQWHMSSLCTKYQNIFKSPSGAFPLDLFCFLLDCLTEVSAFPTPWLPPQLHPEHRLTQRGSFLSRGCSRISFLPQPNSIEGPEPTSADPLADPKVHTLKHCCLCRPSPGCQAALSLVEGRPSGSSQASPGNGWRRGTLIGGP